MSRLGRCAGTQGVRIRERLRLPRDCHRAVLVSSPLARSQMKDTPLIRSAHNGHLHVVQYLLEQGADPATLDLVRTLCAAKALQCGG